MEDGAVEAARVLQQEEAPPNSEAHSMLTMTASNRMMMPEEEADVGLCAIRSRKEKHVQNTETDKKETLRK